MAHREWSFQCYAIGWILIGIWAGSLVYLSIHLFSGRADVSTDHIEFVKFDIDDDANEVKVRLKVKVKDVKGKDKDEEDTRKLEDMVNLNDKNDAEEGVKKEVEDEQFSPFNKEPQKPMYTDLDGFLIEALGITPCDEHYGFTLMNTWNEAAKEYCGGSQGNGKLRCRKIVQPNLPLATRPHVICDADNLIVDFSKFTICQAPVERAEYGLGNMAHFCYGSGAFGAKCKKNNDVFSLDNFPRDHLKDIFKSFAERKDGISLSKSTEMDLSAGNDKDNKGNGKSGSKYTMFITREGSEYANLYHTMCDWMNAFQTMYVMKWKREDVQIVILDNNPKNGPFDQTWADVFAPKYGFKRATSFNEKTVNFENAAFSPPGYSSVLFNYPYGGNDCKQPTGLMRAFKYYFVNSFGLVFPEVTDKTSRGLRVTLVSRKPYKKHGVEHSYMSRQLGNQDQLVEIMQRCEGVETAKAVDFALIDFREQIKIITETDILVGVHGAALSHQCWLPEHAGVLELCQDSGVWRLFENMAYMNGLVYRRWDNENARNYVETSEGSILTVEKLGFEIEFKGIVTNVLSRKKQFL